MKPGARKPAALSRALAALIALAVIIALGVVPAARRLWAGASSGLEGVEGIAVQRLARRDFVRWVPAEGNLRAARSTTLSVPRGSEEASRVAWVAADGSRVRSGEEVMRFDDSDLRKNLAEAESDLTSARFKSEKSAVESLAKIAQLERELRLARTEVANASRFQKKDAMVFSRQAIIESDIDQQLARERERHAAGAREIQETEGRAGTAVLAVDLRKAEFKIRRARAGLAALSLKAPHDGVLILKRDWRGNPTRIGDSVWSGQPVAEIPELAVMEAEVFVLEADAGGLASGKPARIEVESLPGSAFAARLARVDTIAKPRLRGSPVQYFGVTLRLARTDPRVMKPGQRVRAWLRLDERRQALLLPRQALFARDRGTIAYRLRADHRGFEPVAVTLGPAGLGTVVVETGLAPGDLVALRDPTRTAAGAGAAAAAASASAAHPPRAGGAARGEVAQ
ncbi:MAG TPA: HlyD family efflux transporter periplasmic adaptor subunit [Thermoanaerobaculia bacterium]|nr:HlyD family efflux transporter periplasmic adaptor subunit [Thermoanaerobaculia bacterium]